MMGEQGSAPLYPMGVAERLTGLTARQIRYWEQHGLIAPARTKGRHRLFSDGDILRLKEIKRLLQDGMTLERLKEHLAAREARRIAVPKEPPADRFVGRIPAHVSGPARSLYTGANRAELERLIDRRPNK